MALPGVGCPRPPTFPVTGPFLLPPLPPPAQEGAGFNVKLRTLERRQQRIAEVRAKYEWLLQELETTKQHLMLGPDQWLSECKARGAAVTILISVSPASCHPRAKHQASDP